MPQLRLQTERPKQSPELFGKTEEKHMKVLMHALLGLALVGTFSEAPSQAHFANAHALSSVAAAQSNPTQELARVRNATARYHNLEQAEADGYQNLGFCEPGEGCHWINFSLVDGNFDLEHPEILLYAPTENGGMRLVAVEYVVPLSASPVTSPEGFTGDADTWREDTEGAGLWELTVWIWMPNPNGIFEQHN